MPVYMTLMLVVGRRQAKKFGGISNPIKAITKRGSIGPPKVLDA